MEHRLLLPLENQVFIRPAVESDLPALEWNGEYTHFRNLYREVYSSARRGDALLWVAEIYPTGIIGQLFVQLNSSRKELANGFDCAYLYGFRIQPQYRNLGIGSAMLGFVEADLQDRHYRWACLNVNRENHGARRFYERYGYRIVTLEAGIWSYMDDKGKLRQVHEPAWRMAKDLGEKPG